MRRDADFLIVAALDDEARSAKAHLGSLELAGREFHGRVPRSGGGEYRIALVNVGGMGPDDAQRETAAALTRVRASYVILVGIAAGFPEKGVEFGDIMVPERIAPYEKSKLAETRSSDGSARVTTEHRDFTERVSRSLWHTAKQLAIQPEAWTRRITIPRPDGTLQVPKVFIEPDSVIGSGSKIVASEFAEARGWLIASYRGVLGLEMEAIGVFHACLEAGADMLVIKASQDPATALKDAAAEKDVWGEYACDSASAFMRELIAVFRPPSPSFIGRYSARVTEIAESGLAREVPEFDYYVSIAGSSVELKREQYRAEHAPLASILPNDAARYVAIIGGGGTGKSHIAAKLFRLWLEADGTPLLLDMKRYAGVASRRPPSQGVTEEETLQTLITACSAPRVNLPDLEALADESPVLVIVDGLNEVPGNEQELLITKLKQLDGQTSGCYIIATARPGIADRFSGFRYAAVDRLERNEVRTLYDRRHATGGDSAFDALDERLQRILTRPFFIALASRSRPFAGLRSWSEIFEQFFQDHVGMGPDRINEVAGAVFRSLDSTGGIRVSNFRDLVGDREYKNLCDAEVIDRTERAFEHELWRDFLASRHLSRHAALWTDDAFDRVTVDASSLEVLPLTLEQIPETDLRDRFVKEVFDWNLLGAVECLEGDTAAPRERHLSDGIRVALLAAIAEKRFDRIERTRRRAEAQLRERENRLALARRYLAVSTRRELVAEVQRETIPDTWFRQWSEIFALEDGDSVSGAVVAEVESSDSLVGWVAANSLRRATLSDPQEERLRKRYIDLERDPARKTVRWRVVHALGAHPSADNIALIGHALSDDEYPWARYGAARSLMEMAALSEGDHRTQALRLVVDAMPRLRDEPLQIRGRILNEIVEAAFVRNARRDWVVHGSAVLRHAVEVVDEPNKEALAARVDAFMNEDNWQT